MNRRTCWCGCIETLPFSQEYVRCANCQTLISNFGLSNAELKVDNDDESFYGNQYWLKHQTEDLGYSDIFHRAKADLLDRNLHWLTTLLKYKRPPAKTIELGCSHGSFVAMLQMVGFDAHGVEMSPWVVDFAHTTFDIPVFVGPIESLDLQTGIYDVVALMDVLEHLPDPVGTMRNALKLLKPDGILLIQTPEFKVDMEYQALVETQEPFCEQLKSDEHLYLFTKRSAACLFERLGAQYIVFEEAIFQKYDMFFAVSRHPIVKLNEETAESVLESPGGRFVQGMLTQAREIKKLIEHIKVIDEDRGARLDQIHILTKMIHDLQKSGESDQWS